MVFSSIALRLIGGLPHAFHYERRYWVHAAVVVILLQATVQNFWGFLGYRDAEWTLARFAGALAIPGAFYFIASATIPDEPARIESWKEHYFDRRVRLYSGIIFWMCLTAINDAVLLDMPLKHPARAIQLAVVAVGLSGLASARPIVHQILVGLMLIVSAMSAFILMLPAATAR